MLTNLPLEQIASFLACGVDHFWNFQELLAPVHWMLAAEDFNISGCFFCAKKGQSLTMWAKDVQCAHCFGVA